MRKYHPNVGSCATRHKRPVAANDRQRAWSGGFGLCAALHRVAVLNNARRAALRADRERMDDVIASCMPHEA